MPSLSRATWGILKYEYQDSPTRKSHARRSLNGSKPGIYETGGRQYAGRHADDEQDYRNGSEEGPHARPPNFYLSYAAAAT
jgi:hypothetical protein